MIKNLLISIISFVILDGIWFKVFMGDFSRKQLSSLLNIGSNGTIDVNYPAAIGAYICMGIMAAVFVYPKIQGLNYLNSFLIAALAGGIVYGIFDFTNMAIIKDYTWSFVVVDMLWGAFVFGATGVILKLVAKI